MTTKTQYGFCVVAMTAIFGLAMAPTMNSAFATVTYVGSFDTNRVCILNGVDEDYNSGTTNSDGDMDLSADTDHTTGDTGTVHAYAAKKLYFTANTSVTMLAKATVDLENTDGYNHVHAYLSDYDDMWYNSNQGCWQYGPPISGSDATIDYVGPNGSNSGLEVGTSSFTIPSTGYYNVIIYADAQTQVDGGESISEIDNPLIRLTY